ncbi:hypothetical protein Tco_1254160, partial [Tanacetum coccineum]
MAAGESIEDDVIDAEDLTQADASAPKQDKSTWFKMAVVERPKYPNPKWHKEPAVDDASKHTWFNEMVNAEKNQHTFDDVMGSVIDFTNFTKNYLNKDKITKAGLEGPSFKLMKDQLDWMNPKGDRIPHDLSKPLPLHSALGHFTILVHFFFNKDLEYLTNENVKKKYATSLTKLKAARYGYLKEIFVRHANKKEYTFKEADFQRLHLNDIEDMYLLIMIQQRVEDVQIGVESYQTKLNLTMPQVKCVGLDDKEPYTIFHKPRG